MDLNLTFDASVGATAQTAVNAVASYLESLYTDPITINITVKFGNLGPNGLGQSSVGLNSFTYAQIVSALTGDKTTTDDNTSVASLPGTDPLNGTTHTYYLFRGEQKALGLLDANNAASDGTVTFNNTPGTFDFDRSDGITAGQFDFMGVVLHEFTEVMGRAMLTGVSNNAQNGPANGYYPLDLFHYSAPGTRSFVGSSPGYFSADNGNTNRGTFNTSVNGDWGDWGPPIANDAVLAFSNSGVYNDFTDRDERVMDVLGFNLVADDHSDDVNFAGTTVVNGSTSGTLERTSDSDWYRVQLTAGVHYIIRVAGADATEGTLANPFVAVYNSSSVQLAQSQEGSTNDARVEFTPSSTGFYYVDASSFFGAFTGTYHVSVTSDDIVQDTSTTASLPVGGSAGGTINTFQDQDWFRTNLVAGHHYLIEEHGSPSGAGTLSDTYVRLHNSSGTELQHDDDGGLGFESQLAVKAGANGTYYVDAGAYPFGGENSLYLGTYTVDVRDLGTNDFRFEQLHSALNWFTPGSGGWDTQDHYPRHLANVNGDDVADLVGFGDGGVQVALGTGNGNFGAPTFVLAAFGPSAGGWTSDNLYHRELANIDGNGSADIVGFAQGDVEVALSNGSGGFGPVTSALNAFAPGAGGWDTQDHYPRHLADVTGDGKADIVGFGEGGVQVAVATGGGHFAAPVTVLAAFGPSAGGWSSDNLYHRELADVNNDGMADIVGFAQGDVEVALATGGGNFAAPFSALNAFAPGAGGWSSEDVYPRHLADVNGDGMADIVGFGQGGVQVALATGGGHFAAPTFELDNYAVAAGGWSNDNSFHRELADVTGDGRADIVGFGTTTVFDSPSHDFFVV